MKEITVFLEQMAKWATVEPGILAVMLVGSQARGDTKPDSDIDLVIISDEPKLFLEQVEWIREFGKPSRKVFEDWGKVTSVRVWYKDGLEVEFGITNEEWTKEPLDAGTNQVINDGYRILVDKSNQVSQIFAGSSNSRA